MTSTSETTAARSARLHDLVRADESLLVEMRRDLHAHPELSGHETATTAWLGQHLRDLGLAPVRLDVGTGLVCDIPVGGAVAGGAVGAAWGLGAAALLGLAVWVRELRAGMASHRYPLQPRTAD